jgi:hypothetical protein
MPRHYVQPAAIILLGMAALGTILATLARMSMRLARDAYAEIAASCSRISVLTFNDTRYFYTPLARWRGLRQRSTGLRVTRL